MKLMHDLIEAVEIGDKRIDLEEIIFEETHHFLVVLESNFLCIADVIKECAQLALCRDLRIKISQGSSSSVPCILKRISPRLIVRCKYRKIHDPFTLDFNRSTSIRNLKRNGLNRLHLGKNPFPYNPVPPGRRLDQLSICVRQIQGKSVKLQFNYIGRCWQRRIRILRVIVSNQLKNTVIPALQMLLILGFVQTPQGC
ncbi:hypothetical protein D3C81_1323100 [compost metagenome]